MPISMKAIHENESLRYNINMKTYDSVHGFIHFNPLETALIDTEVFQRLHYIHQLGIAYLIYPGGTHTRFEHSLGTMHLATLIFDQIALPEDRAYWRQMVRLAALCHDLGHLPFSHVAEKQLLGEGAHEEWTLKIIESSFLAPVWELAKQEFPGQQIQEVVAKLSLGEEKLRALRPGVSFTSREKVYSQIVTGDFFGADRIDYLLRDAKATGLSYGLFDYTQLIEMLVIFSQEDKLILGVEENGIESCEALLLARHFMQRRVYQYPSGKAFSFHLARFMKILYQDPHHFTSVENYIAMNEPEVFCALEQARKDPHHPGHRDAVCLLDRKKRFVAFHLPPSVEASDLKNFQKEAGIPDADIHWDLSKKHSLHSALSLLILRKNKQIVPADQFSEILIPPSKKNWLFLSPQYEYSVNSVARHC